MLITSALHGRAVQPHSCALIELIAVESCSRKPPKFFVALTEDMQLLEFFAGTANLTKCFRLGSLRSARFDILYAQQQEESPGKKPKKERKHQCKGKQTKRRSNFMDILSPSGFLFLSLIGLLRVFETHSFVGTTFVN